MEVLDKGVWRGQESNDSIILQTKISTEYPEFSKVGKDMISDAIILVSKENTIDSAKQYVTSCVWDKTPRLDSWLTMVYGAEDNKYHQAVGSNWLKGMVKRIMEPGCKFDHILVLEGEQGSKKSTSLSVLGGSWHVETTMSTENKDFFMQFQGKAIIEFSEGETLNRTEVKRMKAIITTQYDKYRPPYERLSQDFPRRCVFAMTTNESEYLKDETGNRRWLPVTLVKPEADVEWLASNRDQLFAEAFYRLYTLKETVHEFPKEETRDEQAKRRIQDPNSEAIVDWYVTSLTDEQRRDGVTANMAFDKVIKGGSGKSIDRLQEMIIGGVFRESLKLEKRRIKKNGVQAWRWFSKLETLPASDDLDVKNW
jgi:predicted P-loop ATPase